MATETNDTVFTLDIKSLIKEALHRWVTIVAIFLVCVLVAFIYGQFITTPKYTSSAAIYAANQDDAKISTSEIAISTYLTKDCCELILSRAVLEDVIANLGLNMTYESLKSAVTVSNNEETRFINVKVTTSDAKKSCMIANGICEVAKEKIIELLGVDWVKITDTASLPKAPSSPSVASYVIYGFLIAVVVSLGFIFISLYRNDKISSYEDIEKYLGICTLATIPYNRNKSKSYYQKKR